MKSDLANATAKPNTDGETSKRNSSIALAGSWQVEARGAQTYDCNTFYFSQFLALFIIMCTPLLVFLDLISSSCLRTVILGHMLYGLLLPYYGVKNRVTNSLSPKNITLKKRRMFAHYGFKFESFSVSPLKMYLGNRQMQFLDCIDAQISLRFQFLQYL